MSRQSELDTLYLVSVGLLTLLPPTLYFRFPITVLFPRKNCWSFIDFHLVLSGSSVAIVKFWNNLVDPYRNIFLNITLTNIIYMCWIFEWELSFFYILVISILNVNVFQFYGYEGFHVQNSSIHLLNSFFNPNEISKNPLVENCLVLVPRVRN